MNLLRIAGFLCLAFICATTSCKVTVVGITDADTATQQLVLKTKDGNSADTIDVKENEKVIWRIKTSKVKKITDIDDKGTITPPKFITHHKPHKKFLSKSWVLKVNRVSQDEFKDSGYTKEYYYISWKPNGADSSKTYDPLMKIYPSAH